MRSTARFVVSLLVCLSAIAPGSRAETKAASSFSLGISPPEHRRMVDPKTGAELLFLSTNPGDDGNLYYEQRSWLADSSLILFQLGKPGSGLTGYLTRTGELVRLTTPNGSLGGVTAAKDHNAIYGYRAGKIIELSLTIHVSSDPARHPSTVAATERVIADLGPVYRSLNCALSESADGKYLSFGAGARAGSPADSFAYVGIVNVQTGDVRQLRQVQGSEYHGHIMFSLTNPNLLSYKGEKDTAMEVIDIRTAGTVWSHKPKAGVEMATHHCWWVSDTVTFCGGFHLKPREDADVKVANVWTGEIRILGRGNWWPGGTPIELATANWWHAAGDESGRWVAADNWHGDIGIFHGRTTRTYWLTNGHRTYGDGRHPEVGWDRLGKQVIFASHMLGNVDVCVATIPKAWQDEWDQQ